MLKRSESSIWGRQVFFCLYIFLLLGCTVDTRSQGPGTHVAIESTRVEQADEEAVGKEKETKPGGSEIPLADVLQVKVSGEIGAYNFAVEIASPDTGCEQYADWWEVLSVDGRLLYRRILTHSHVNEQPFTRSGGPLVIEKDTVVIVRAHMHPAGYGGVVLEGSVQDGFTETRLEAGFAEELERSEPLPEGCAF